MIPPTYPSSGLFHSISQESFFWDTTCKCLPCLAPCPHGQQCLPWWPHGWETLSLWQEGLQSLCTAPWTPAAKAGQSLRCQQLQYEGSLCVNRPTMQIWFKGIFLMEIAWYFSSRSKFFDVGVSGRWEISSNSHGTFSVFRKRRKSFYQHFDHKFIQNHTTFYFNASQLLMIFLRAFKILVLFSVLRRELEISINQKANKKQLKSLFHCTKKTHANQHKTWVSCS